MKSKYTLLAYCFLLSASVVAQQKDTAGKDKIYTYVEQMPEAGYDWNKYLSENLQYPDSARQNNIQGRVIVKFIVNEDGGLSDALISRGIGSGCDEEVLRVIKNAPAWKPAKQNGRAVRVFFTLPVTFKLEDPAPEKKDTISNTAFEHVKHMPKPHYDYGQFLSDNLKYPEGARRRGAEGQVFVKFIVNEDGHISDCFVPWSIDGELDAEALRVVRKSPPWSPGMQDGKPVKVFFTLPINFRLDNKERAISVHATNLVPAELKPGEPTPGYNFNNYLAENLKYPFNAQRKHIEGKVMIAFTVDVDGSISDCRVEKGIGGGCDEEALRVIRKMPKWQPDQNKPTKSSIILPIEFKLPKVFQDN